MMKRTMFGSEAASHTESSGLPTAKKHLVANSTKEEDAEKAAREFRRRFDDARKQTALKPLRSASQEAKDEVFDDQLGTNRLSPDQPDSR